MKNKHIISLSLLMGLFLQFSESYSQINIVYYINSTESVGRRHVSPYIYGVNQTPWSQARTENIGAKRLGGNRLTTYNWEQNFSNAGADCCYPGYNNNDLYDLQTVLGYYSNDQSTGKVLEVFHDTSLAVGAYSLVTMPMAGYVSKPINASITTTAPSADWDQSYPTKGSAFSLTPSTTDGKVYADEMVNWVVNKFGASNTSTGLKGYCLDNEPDIWNGTHPLVHPDKVGCQELIDRSTQYSAAIKSVDPNAEVYGLVASGYNGFTTLNSAPDWDSFSATYPWYIDAYLDKMKVASNTAGKRLLDVLDIHWYSEHTGLDVNGYNRRVWGDGAAWEYDPGVCQARMQAPRSLWDPTFKEKGWIGANGTKAVNLLPIVTGKINSNYPGTKLSVSEWSYSGTNHISGGIATADALGIFGNQGIYLSTFWGSISGYISSAYKLFRNYDGKKSTYGDLRVNAAAVTTDIPNTSIYASVSTTTDSIMHIIILNKNWTDAIDATINIYPYTNYIKGKVYAFDSTHVNIRLVDSLSNIVGNKFTYKLPKLSATHFVLSNGGLVTSTTSSVEDLKSIKLMAYPNPSNGSFSLKIESSIAKQYTACVKNTLGKKVVDDFIIESNEIATKGEQLAAGLYFVEVTDGTAIESYKIIKY